MLIPLVSKYDVTGFPIFITCRCCDGNIIGCYAPNGEHCERPLEVRHPVLLYSLEVGWKGKQKLGFKWNCDDGNGN